MTGCRRTTVDKRRHFLKNKGIPRTRSKRQMNPLDERKGTHKKYPPILLAFVYVYGVPFASTYFSI